jgi:hypothetical protein
MRVFRILLALLGLLACDASAVADQPLHPDFGVAYALATASYCAYAVGPTFEGKEQPDNGKARAFRCVRAASSRDPTLAKLGFVVGNENDVSVSPRTGQGFSGVLSGGGGFDGYLLLNTPMGVVLAFRGTLLPPVSPDEATNLDRVDEMTKVAVNAAAVAAWGAFVSDWINNAKAPLDERQRHMGFDESWARLREHLKPSCSAGSPESSAFCTFVAERGGVRPTLFVTGHSKGGALATLAGLDLGAALPNVPQRVFTFAAAKSVASDEARSPAYDARQFWRFERGGDLVPTLPTDDSLPFLGGLAASPVGQLLRLSTYAQFGPRVLYARGMTPTVSAPTNGRDSPDDWARWRSIAKVGAPNLVQILLTKTLQKDRKFECLLLVDHLGIFGDVQSSAWPDGAPPADVDANRARFFRFGLRDDDKKSVMPGYEDWCAWLNAL